MAGNALDIKEGGTSQITAPGARKALGLEIGVAVQAHDNDLDAISAMTTTGLVVRSAADTWTTRTLTAPAAGMTITNPAGLAGNPTFVLANDLAALEALSTTGLVARTASETYVPRTLTAPAAGFTITNPAGIAGDPTFVLANDLAALESMSGTGLAVHTGTSTWTERTLIAPAAGITITNGSGVSGNPTLVLANDLLGVEGLAANGIVTRTATDTWTVRTLAGTANEITATNGDGIAGAPTFSLPTALTFTGKTVTGGTFNATAFNGPIGGTTPATAVFVGVSTNSNAAAGQIGEVISASIASGSTVALTNSVAKTVTSISLTAGDWDVHGLVGFFPATTTSIVQSAHSISLTTDTMDFTEGSAQSNYFTGGQVVGLTATRLVNGTVSIRLSLASTTTVFLVALSSFTVSSNGAYGKIWARRAR